MFTMMLKGVEEQKEWDLLEDLKKKKRQLEIRKLFSVSPLLGLLES